PDVMGVARERGHGQRTGSPGGAESTRQLSADERVAAALLTAGTQTSDLMPSPWRGRGILILVSAVVALVAGVIFTFVAGTGRETGGAPRPPSKVALGTAVEGRGDLGMDAGTRRERARDGAAVATTSDADSGGMTTRGSNDAAATSAPRAHRHRPHSRCRRVRGKGSRRASRRRPKRSVSRAEVRRKFRKIKVLYKRFERAYGGRLKDEWQRILFGLTYRKIESAALDRMLDGLRRKMVAIRRGS
ncbi:MAG: hypothetical protein KAI47_03250, partial [Deltaproteobacteria bacterium]|nr:hypothetical protein [Deltaproteobacteria bacterium]